MPEATTTTLRAFNQTWSRHLGVLEESFLGTGRSLGASRLIVEIGRGPGGRSVRELRSRLGLDSGYLSRLLRGLERDGLVDVEPDPDDARRRVVTLTERGSQARADLDRRSELLARGLLDGLSPAQRERLDAALAEAERLLRAGSVRLEPVAPDDPEAVAAVGRYVAELDARFPGGFDPGDAATSDVAGMAPPGGSFLVARSGDAVVACGGVQPHQPGVGEIKRMWVDPGWRGLGLGGRMLAALESEVRRLGYPTVYLDTNGTLTEAVEMYHRAGYHPIERYNDNPYAQHWFAKSLA